MRSILYVEDRIAAMSHHEVFVTPRASVGIAVTTADTISQEYERGFTEPLFTTRDPPRQWNPVSII